VNPLEHSNGPPGDDDLGALGVAHLARMWATVESRRSGGGGSPSADDAEYNRIVLDGLGLGLEPTTACVWRHARTFAEFEAWILAEKGGELDPARVRRVNAIILGEQYDDATSSWLAAVDAAPPVLDDTDLKSWVENGYVTVPDVLDAAACRDAEQAVWDYLSASPHDSDSWYSAGLNGIMVQLFQDPALEVARRAAQVHKAFAQLWGTADLLVTTDRCGFNPPERPGWSYPGPRLHWDLSLEPPLGVELQGLLYLTDTAADQGAFVCVPGFHRQIDDWLAADPGRQDQNSQDLNGFKATAIAGKAGDLIIWNGALPHASSPNRASAPRIVQYLKMAPPFPDRFRARHQHWSGRVPG
jgi:hypothetical protein